MNIDSTSQSTDTEMGMSDTSSDTDMGCVADMDNVYDCWAAAQWAISVYKRNHGHTPRGPANRFRVARGLRRKATIRGAIRRGLRMNCVF